MFATITALVVRLAAIRWAIKTLVGVGVLAAPVLFVLFLFGLPVFLVLIVGAMLLAGLFFMLTIGMVAFKIFLFVVLPMWLIWKLVGFLFRVFRPRQETMVAS